MCNVICPWAGVLLGGKTIDHLYGNRRKFASILLTDPMTVIGLL